MKMPKLVSDGWAKSSWDVLLCIDREELSTKETKYLFLCVKKDCFLPLPKTISYIIHAMEHNSGRGLLILDVHFPYIFPIDVLEN